VPERSTRRWAVRHTTFRESGHPNKQLVLSDLTRELREEELLAWQRLVRVLCQHCKQEDHSPTAQAFKASLGIPASATIYRSVGCRECRNTGFYGRHGIFEWMDTDENIRQMILKSASTDQIRDTARRAGMRTLAEDGWRLVARGITTVEEVLSVTTAKEVARTTKQESPNPAPAVSQAAG